MRVTTRHDSPEDLDEGGELTRLHVPVKQPAHHPQLGHGGDESQGGDQGQGPVLEDKLLQLRQRVGGQDVVQQEVREEIAVGLRKTVSNTASLFSLDTLKDT